MFLNRSTQFMLLALLLSTANTYASTLAASLFLARAGADSLPLYYMCFAALSIPLSLFFSTIIDRWPRAQTLKVMLIGFAGVSLVLALITGTEIYSLYILYLGISICELLTFSVYYVLLADHFTATEAKRHTGTIAVCMAGGGLIGGGLVGITMSLLTATGALFVAPGLVLIALLHLIWLTRRERPLDEMESADDENLIQSLKTHSRLVRRYPIVALLAGAVFLNILLQCFSEYLAFSIYAQRFTNETDLAAFLGIVNAGLNILGVAVVFIFTNPMMTKLGVARFNLVFPAINLAALASIIVDQRLPSAILAHISYDPLAHSIDVPVFTMNYNAVPHRFVGRVRVVNDGVAYPLALATAGALLLVLTNWLDLAQMAAVALAIGLAFVAVHWGIGRNYLRSLIDMLRSGAIDLDHAGDGFRLPHQYRDDVRAMLASDDLEIVGIALEIAARSDIVPSAAELERALALVPSARELSVLHRIARSSHADAGAIVSELARSGHAHIRAAAAEVMVAENLPLIQEHTYSLSRDPDIRVRAIATTADWLAQPNDMAAERLLNAVEPNEIAALAVCRILAVRSGEAALPLLDKLAHHHAPAVTVEALATLDDLAWRGAVIDIDRIDDFTQADDPATRARAFQLLARHAPAYKLAGLARRGLADLIPSVRHATATALGSQGETALPALAAALRGSPEQRDAAIEGLGLLGGRQADDVLFAFIEPRVLDQVARNVAMLRRIPAGRPGWRALATAVADANDQAVHLVLQCLAALGYRRTLKAVRTMLAKGDARKRSHAVETLSALAHRRYVLPLMPLLENNTRTPVSVSDQGLQALLETALGSADPYIRAGAAIAWHAEYGHVPPQIAADRHAFVTQTAEELSMQKLAAQRLSAPPDGAKLAHEEIVMNRLVFLKSIPMFAEMTLENLIAIDAAMKQEVYLPDEDVVTEGDVGDKLFIVYRGTVAVRKTGNTADLARLGSGQVFGEMSLFDDEPRSASVVALDETEVLSLERDQFHSLVHQRPQIVMEICKVLVGRLRTAIS